MYSGVLSDTPVILNSLRLTASERFTESGTGVLTGGAGGSGTIDYDTGVWSITLGSPLTASYNAVASYFYGESLSALPFQVVSDFTPIHSFPEMSRNDTDFATIYTRMVRSLDTKLNVLVASSCTATTGHITTLTSNSLTATNITGSTSITSPIITASSYLKVGNKYLFSGDVTEVSASIVAAASSLVTIASLKGSLFMNTSNLWYFTATNTAATVTW